MHADWEGDALAVGLCSAEHDTTTLPISTNYRIFKGYFIIIFSLPFFFSSFQTLPSWGGESYVTAPKIYNPGADCFRRASSAA